MSKESANRRIAEVGIPMPTGFSIVLFRQPAQKGE
jgi:hypothetical protein